MQFKSNNQNCWIPWIDSQRNELSAILFLFLFAVLFQEKWKMGTELCFWCHTVHKHNFSSLLCVSPEFISFQSWSTKASLHRAESVVLVKGGFLQSMPRISCLIGQKERKKKKKEINPSQPLNLIWGGLSWLSHFYSDYLWDIRLYANTDIKGLLVTCCCCPLSD